MKETELFLKTMKLRKEYETIADLNLKANEHENLAKAYREEAISKLTEYETSWVIFKNTVETKSDYESSEAYSTDSYDSRDSLESPVRDGSPTRSRTTSFSQGTFKLENLDQPKLSEISLMESRLQKLHRELNELESLSSDQENLSVKPEELDKVHEISSQELKKEISRLTDMIAFRKVNLGIY